MKRHHLAALLALAASGASAVDLSIRFQADPYCDFTMPPEGVIAARGGDVKLEGSTADDKTITCKAEFTLAPLPPPVVVAAWECIQSGAKHCRSDFPGGCAPCIPAPTCELKAGSTTSYCWSHSTAQVCYACTPPPAVDPITDEEHYDGPSLEEEAEMMCWDEHMEDAEQRAEAACYGPPEDDEPTGEPAAEQREQQ